MSAFDFVMRGWDSTGGKYVYWVSPTLPDFAGDYYTSVSPTFASLTDVGVARRRPAGNVGAGDWVRHPGVLGPNGKLAFVASDYPDLNTLDAQGALLRPPSVLSNGRLLVEPKMGLAETTYCGVRLTEVPAGNFVSAARVAIRYIGQRIGGGADWQYGLAYAEAQGSAMATSNWHSFGYGRQAGAISATGTALQVYSTAAGRGGLATAHSDPPSLETSHVFDVAVKASGALLLSAVGMQGSWSTLANKALVSVDGTLALLARAKDVTVTDFRAELIAYAPPGVFSDWPSLS